MDDSYVADGPVTARLVRSLGSKRSAQVNPLIDSPPTLRWKARLTFVSCFPFTANDPHTNNRQYLVTRVCRLFVFAGPVDYFAY